MEMKGYGNVDIEEYCIGHIDGSPVKSSPYRQRVIQCLKAAIMQSIYELIFVSRPMIMYLEYSHFLEAFLVLPVLNGNKRNVDTEEYCIGHIDGSLVKSRPDRQRVI
ncbi:ACT domain-containing protein ACR4 isoform X2 [Tanacetum coccineum]